MIPRVTKDAIEESFMSVSTSLANLNDEKAKKKIENTILAFKTRQPDIFEHLSHIFKFHLDHNKGMCHVQQLTVYLILIMNSLYIQEELNEVKKIFDFDDTPPEDDNNYNENDFNEEDPENPEDYL